MKKNSKTTILFSTIAVISATIVMIIFSIARKNITNTYTMSRNEEPGGLDSESIGCPYFEFLGDQICDDEANTEECQFDYGDCCDGQNDFSMCSECFCYSSGHLINNTLIHACTLNNQFKWYLGDGKCQMNLNNIQYFFDAGDCCLDSPDCQMLVEGNDECLWGTGYAKRVKAIDIVCPEKVCIKSDVYCIEEFMGDGICDDFNNSNLCEFDLGDCCGPNKLDGALDTCCICECLPSIFYTPNPDYEC